MGAVFGRISFFVNAGVRFVEEHAKLRAMARAVGRARTRALRRRRRAPPPLPLRRAGELARADRGAAGEQRAADRARGAGRHARAATPARGRSSSRPGTRRSGCRARGTSSGRCGSSRCWPTRPTCSSTPTSSRARRSWTGSSPSCSPGAREEMARVDEQGGAVEAVPYMKAALVESHRERHPPDRVGRAGDGRRQPLRGDRAVAADRRRRHPGGRPGGRAGGARRARALARRARRRVRRAGRAAPRGGERREHHAGDDRRRPRRRDHRRVGRRAARRVRLLPRADRRRRGRRAGRSARSWPSCATRSPASATRSAAG